MWSPPDLFPPCMRNLIEKAERGTELSPPESFALMAFLVGIGMTPDEVVTFCADTSLDAEGIRYHQTEYLSDDRGASTRRRPARRWRTTGSATTRTTTCRSLPTHAYYEARVDKADEITDWREQNAAAGKAEIE